VFCGQADGMLSIALSTPKTAGQSNSPPAFTIVQAHERHVSCVGVSPSGDALCTALGWFSKNLGVKYILMNVQMMFR
jgi:hypothetical protein